MDLSHVFKANPTGINQYTKNYSPGEEIDTPHGPGRVSIVDPSKGESVYTVDFPDGSFGIYNAREVKRKPAEKVNMKNFAGALRRQGITIV